MNGCNHGRYGQGLDDDDEVVNAMLTKKAVGIDGISCELLNAAAPAIVQSVTKIIKKSSTTGIFPDVRKTVKVTPVHKSGPPP